MFNRLIFHENVKLPLCIFTLCLLHCQSSDSVELFSSQFFINLFTDFTEKLAQLPPSNFERRISTSLMRKQHDLVSKRQSRSSEWDTLSTNPKDVEFYFFGDRRNHNHHIRLNTDSHFGLPDFLVGPNQQIKILIHGFNQRDDEEFPIPIKNSYLRNTNHLVIIVDWKPLSIPPDILNAVPYYPAVAANVPLVGERVFHLIEFLLRARIVRNFEQVHLVGFSLGSHVAGTAGKKILQKYGRRIGRITGLDPAGPLFRSQGPETTLDKSDADFVDVVHTSVSGLFAPIGHVDFYPNGGQVHSRCLGEFVNFVRCNHRSSFIFFEMSIREELTACGCESFRDFRDGCGWTCEKRTLFGEPTPHWSRGTFYLDIK